MDSLTKFVKDYIKHVSATAKLSREMAAKGIKPVDRTNPDSSFILDVGH